MSKPTSLAQLVRKITLIYFQMTMVMATVFAGFMHSKNMLLEINLSVKAKLLKALFFLHCSGRGHAAKNWKAKGFKKSPNPIFRNSHTSTCATQRLQSSGETEI